MTRDSRISDGDVERSVLVSGRVLAILFRILTLPVEILRPASPLGVKATLLQHNLPFSRASPGCARSSIEFKLGVARELSELSLPASPLVAILGFSPFHL